MTARSGRAGGERRTAAAPVYGRGRFAVSSAREVGERSERLNLAGGEGGDTLTLYCACMDESNEHESESRELQQDHDRRGKGKNESALTGLCASTMAYIGYGDVFRPVCLSDRKQGRGELLQ